MPTGHLVDDVCEKCDTADAVVIDGLCPACAQATAWSRPTSKACAGCQALVQEVARLGDELAALAEKVAGIQRVNNLWDGS